jgi:hypothetical protein
MKFGLVAWISGTLLAGTAMASSPPSMAQRLTVHEWGTFTVLQDEQGNAISGINTDDEPVPAFVHGVTQEVIHSDTQVPPVYFKGLPGCDRSAYVRLETPVIYFHAPPGFAKAIDVDVEFHGGWLTQYYPDAHVETPGLANVLFAHGLLTDTTVGTLSWHNLRLGTNQAGPTTADPVWLSPRRVDATDLTAENGESERFIFYRGVGHLKTPLRVARTADANQFEIRADFAGAKDQPSSIGPLWLVDVRNDGKVAVRSIQRLALDNPQAPPRIDATFTDGQYSSDRQGLRISLRNALIGDGLYEDEAEALLNTWETSYFRRPGLRLFYLVPGEWTDRALPLKLGESGHPGEPLAAEVRRVMVGRIELVTPHHRERLAQIARGPASNPQWMFDALKSLGSGREDMYREDWFKMLMNGKQTLAGLRINVPADYRAYLELGRFRNAIILDEASKRPTPALTEFIQAYALSR